MNAPCFFCELFDQVVVGTPDAQTIHELFGRFNSSDAPVHEIAATLCDEHMAFAEEMCDQLAVALDYELAKRKRRQLRLVTED